MGSAEYSRTLRTNLWRHHSLTIQMMKISDTLRFVVFSIMLIFSVYPLSAQRAKNIQEKKPTSQETVAVQAVNADSLQHVIDSLQNALQEMESRYEAQQQALQHLRDEADSLRNGCDMSYLLNYGNALLYRKYSARVEDVAILLSAAPDSLKQKDWDQMLDQARRMIQSSKVTQDMRTRVFHLLESVPQSEQFAEDIREVLRNVPADAQIEYTLTRHAIDLIDALPKNVTDSNNRYAIVKNLLEEYQTANEEIKNVLLSIQNHPDNNINISEKWPAFEKQIKNTQYYKHYYDKSWNIPYLNSIIDQALARLQNATKRVDLKDLIDNL